MYLLQVFQIYTAFTLAYIWFGVHKIFLDAQKVLRPIILWLSILDKLKLRKRKVRKGFNLKVQSFSNLPVTESPYSIEVFVKCFAMSMRYS